MTGNKTLDKIIIIFNLIGILLGFGIFVFTEFISQRELPVDNAEFQRLLALGNEISNLKAFELEKLTLNLSSERSRLRYLDVVMHLLPFHESQMTILDQYKPLILDNIIEITGRMTPEEVNSVTGKIIFEDRIKKMTNDLVKKPIIKKIYFRFLLRRNA